MKNFKVGVACNSNVKDLYLGESDLKRLGEFAEIVVEIFEVGGDPWGLVPITVKDEQRLITFSTDLDALIVCHGAPRVTEKVFAAAKNLKVVGDIEGDRFAGRIDIPAARAAGIMVVDTTHASSWPVSEWALALAMIGLRQHARFRQIIAGEKLSYDNYRTEPPARELTGKSVGLIGFGHIAWRLRELLVPFRCPILAYDPFAPRELADSQDVDFASLETVMNCDVVICLVPATPKTVGMIGKTELDMLKDNAVFVNVSRGVVVDVTALIAKARQGDAWFGLDAHDPEPLAVDSPLRDMGNVFLSPHIAGVTAESQLRFFALMVDELERFITGREPRAQITDRVVAGRGGAN